MPLRWIHHRHFTPIFLGACALAAFLLWLPAVQYPIVSDSTLYALLGESLWTRGEFSLFGEPHGKYLPFHPFVSYPFVWALGMNLGMKLSTLLAGVGVLIATYVLIERTFSRDIAVFTTLAVLFHHAFPVMTQLGSADPLLSLLVLLSLLAFHEAGRDPRWYIVSGTLLGLACITRLNPVPLFLFYPIFVLWKRKSDVRAPWFWLGMGLGVGILALWFLRGFLVFGAYEREYAEELSRRSVGLLPQFFVNIRYYLHPMRNIMPALFLLSFYGAFRARRKQGFLIGAGLALLALFAVWPVLNLRYAFPAYILMIAFAIFGARDLATRFSRGRGFVLSGVVALVVLSDLFALCIYSYGACNAWFDRTVGVLPKNLGLAMEGFHTWDQARDFINREAEKGAAVDVRGPWNVAVMRTGVFREDLRIVGDIFACPTYAITQQPELDGGEVVFETQDEPKTFVVKQGCS